MSEIRKVINAIGRTKPTKWWIHETVVCKTTNVQAWDGMSVRQWLTLVILAIKKSYIGNKSDKIKTGCPAVDLMSSERNELNIHCIVHGKAESFSTKGDLKATKSTVNRVPSSAEILFFRCG
jgi:hypothetical protein